MSPEPEDVNPELLEEPEKCENTVKSEPEKCDNTSEPKKKRDKKRKIENQIEVGVVFRCWKRSQRKREGRY